MKAPRLFLLRLLDMGILEVLQAWVSILLHYIIGNHETQFQLLKRLLDDAENDKYFEQVSFLGAI